MNPDFLDMLSALNDEQARYLVVGAYAMAAHRCPRATGDLDLWVSRDPENANRVWRALIRFGAPKLDLSVEDLQRADIVFQIGQAPRRVDILTSISGVEFDEAWAQRLETKVGEVRILVLGREQLLKKKRATGRPKDLADVAILEEASRNHGRR